MFVLGDIGSGLVAWLCLVLACAGYLGFAGRRAETVDVGFRLLPVAGFYAVYEGLVQWSEKPSVVRLALRNGEGIADAERRLHLFVEPWLSSHSLPGFVPFYDWAQVVVVLGLVCYLAVNEGAVFWRVARNSLALTAVAGFLCYWLTPVAPPWVLPGSYGIHSAGLHNLTGVGELMGAFPSLHTAWAGWAAVVCWSVFRGPWRWLGVANLVLTAWVVVATGNHYVVDVVGGEVVAASACMVASWWSLRRDWSICAVCGSEDEWHLPLPEQAATGT